MKRMQIGREKEYRQKKYAKRRVEKQNSWLKSSTKILSQIIPIEH